MRWLSAMAVGLVALASARPALAAEKNEPDTFGPPGEQTTYIPRVGFNIGAGVAFPLAEAGSRFKTGGDFQLGATFNFTRRLGVQAEYLYSGYNVQSNVLASSGVQGYHNMQYGDLNAVYTVLPNHPFGVYVLGGPGIYHRRVDITRFAGTAFVPYCDPWLFFCYTTPVSVEQVLGSRSRTDFGLNAGAGVSLRIFGGPIQLYAEGRYHYIFGSIDTPSGSRRATGQYIPLVFGLRL